MNNAFTKSLKSVVCAAVVCGGAACTPAFGYVDESLDPSIGWVVTNETTRVAEERLTPEQEAAGVKPWMLKLGGNWNSISMDSVSQVGDNTTLELGKKFLRKSTEGILKIGMKGSVFKNKTTIKKLTLPTDISYMSFSANGYQFSGCTGLEEVSPFLPDGMTIAGSIFSGCTALKGDLVLKGGTTFDTYSLQNTKISSVFVSHYNNQIITFGKQALLNCTSLTNIVVEAGTNGWRTVGTTAGSPENFKGCTGLRDFSMTSFPNPLDGTSFATHIGSSSQYHKIRFLVPRDIVDDSGLLTGGITPWKDLDQSIKDKFKARWPGEKHPLGVINKAEGATKQLGIYNLPANQFIAYLPDSKLGMKVLFK